MKKYNLIVFMVVLLFSTTQAQKIYQLSDWVQLSIDNSFQYKNLQLLQRIAENNNKWGEAGLLPSINLSLAQVNNYNRINNPTSFLNGANVIGTNNTLGVDLQWTLYEGGKVKLNKNRLELFTEQTQWDASYFLDQLLSQISKAYFTALIQKKKIQFLEQNLQLTNEKLNYVLAKNEYGQAGSFDLLQLFDARLADSIQLIIQTNQYELSMQNLLLLAGLDPNEKVEIDTKLPLVFDQREFNDYLESMKKNNFLLKQEQVKKALVDLEYSIQKTALYPKITLSSNISEQFNLTRVSGKEPLIADEWKGGSTFNGGLNFNFIYSLYNGGKIRRAIANAQIKREIAENQYLDLERKLSQSLQIAFKQYKNLSQIFTFSNRLIENSKKNLEIASERFSSGLLNYFDFRTIQASAIKTELLYLDAYLNVKNAEVELLYQASLLKK